MEKPCCEAAAARMTRKLTLADGFQVTEPPIKIDATMSLGTHGRVLVLLDGPYYDDTGALIETDPHGLVQMRPHELKIFRIERS